MDTSSPVIKCIASPGARLPSYQTSGSAGADIYAFVDTDVVIPAGEYRLVPTGIKMEIPFGYEVQIRPRSGLAAKYGVTCLNAPGTIDSDYRGEIKVLLINHGKAPFTVRRGERIAQMVAVPVVQAQLLVADSLSETGRGEGGFGSTGNT